MNEQRNTVVLVLRSGGDFSFKDVELISRHIHGKWKSSVRPRIICLCDKATTSYNLGNIEIIPLNNEYPGTWSRIQLYSPEMEQYRPFLYVDLDTTVISSLENIFSLVKDPSQFITLEDFWQKDKLATGLVWFPAKSEKINKVWKATRGVDLKGYRMDYLLRKIITPDKYWQDLTNGIYDAKPKGSKLIQSIPAGTNLVCFHGKPRIFEAVEKADWVKSYVNEYFNRYTERKRVTVIIPYNKDRGWLHEATDSVPEDVQLILSKGDGNWPQNFNKVLNQAEGDYIKYLHEDDKLSPNCIIDSVQAIEEQNVDFIHGNAIEFLEKSGRTRLMVPSIKKPTFQDLLQNNMIHSATTMYKKEVFEKLGCFDESDKVRTFEEYEFNLRCLQNGMKIGYCPSVLAYYRRHSAQLVKSMSKKDRKLRKDEFLKKYKVA